MIAYKYMEYKLKRTSRKTLALKINDMGKLVVCAPKKCSLKYIEDFIKSKENWINYHIQEVKQKRISHQVYFDLNKIVIFGESYNIIDNGNHYLIGDYYVKHTKSSNKKNVLKKFITKLAGEYVLPRVNELAKMLKLEYKNAEIISARKKWGSCNNLKCLKFNFRLVMLPKVLIDYVICHELCHLKELNHSKEFWMLIENLGFKRNLVKTKMKEYSFALQML